MPEGHAYFFVVFGRGADAAAATVARAAQVDRPGRACCGGSSTTCCQPNGVLGRAKKPLIWSRVPFTLVDVPKAYTL